MDMEEYNKIEKEYLKNKTIIDKKEVIEKVLKSINDSENTIFDCNITRQINSPNTVRLRIDIYTIQDEFKI
jgi:hypothetical protein